MAASPAKISPEERLWRQLAGELFWCPPECFPEGGFGIGDEVAAERGEAIDRSFLVVQQRGVANSLIRLRNVSLPFRSNSEPNCGCGPQYYEIVIYWSSAIGKRAIIVLQILAGVRFDSFHEESPNPMGRLISTLIPNASNLGFCDFRYRYRELSCIDVP